MNRRDIMKLVTGSAVGTMASMAVSPGISAAMGPKRVELRRRRVTTADGVSLNVVETGRTHGPSIVFVHGTSQGWQSWINQLSDEALRDQFRLVALDLRGHNESEGAQGALDEDGIPFEPLPDSKYNTGDPITTARLWANDIEAVIKGLDLYKPTLVGWSFGGFVVQDYLVTKGGLGDAGRALIVTSVPALADTGDASFSLLLTPEAGAALGKTFGLDSSVSPPQPATSANIAVGLTEFVELCFADDAPSRLPVRDADVQASVAFNLRTAPNTRQAALSRRFDYRAFLAGLPAKTRAKIQVITALSDHIIPPAAAIDLWDDANLVNDLVPDEGHLYFYRNPEDFNAQLAAFADP